MIDAQFRSEEKYAKLSLGYDSKDEGVLVSSEVGKVIAKYKIQPQTYTSKGRGGREVLVIEYQDDADREAGDVFEEIIKILNIKECD
jgi:endo-alpha-1,4-polygalactosaminidase (GH114 family)